jgi:hypothetical protein
MTFFYDLNKKLDSIRATPEVTHKQLNERDEGKPGKNFAKIAKDAGERYGSKAAGERVAGAVRNKLKAQGKLEEDQLDEKVEVYRQDAPTPGQTGTSTPYRSADKEFRDKLAGEVRTARNQGTFKPTGGDTYNRMTTGGSNGSKIQAMGMKNSGQKQVEEDQLDEKVEVYTRGADADWASMSRTGKNPNNPGAVAHRKSAADAARAARTGGDLKFKGQSPVTDIATTGQGAKVQATRSPKDVQEGGSYLNYADSAAENPAPPKKPMAAPAPKPQGVMDKVKSIGNKVAGGINKLVGHGSDEDMIRDLQRKSGAPVTGKKPEQKTTEAAKYRDPKYKDRLYTQEPPDYTYGPDMDDAYDNPKPDDYAGRKRKIGGGEFPSTDPLASGLGIGRSGIKNNILDRGSRKGMPSRNQISSLKGSIKSARGTHAEPNLPEDGAPMTAKQKSFAKLAPPADKITFADKIAGAKKEVDEMLGQVAAEAMRNAVGGGQGRNAAMDEERSKGTAFDMSTPRAAKPKVGSIERGHKHDIKHTATGRMVTRRVDDQGNSVGADDASDAQAGPRGRGRPKGTTGAIGAKGPSGKSKLMTREGDVSTGNLQQMWQLVTTLKAFVQDPEGQALLKELTGMVKHYVNQGKEAPVDEEKTSTRDDRAEKAGKKVTKDIEYDEGHKGKDDNKAEKAGKKVTKDIEYDEKKKDKEEEEVDESTTSGSVATSTATKSSKGGIVGKGIYDSMNFELEQMIAESMSINMSDSTEGGKSLTITATDEDAMKLAVMLKSAGLGGQGRELQSDHMHSHAEEPCETCGMPDCGCGDVEQAVDENAPDWPTNTETSPDALQYSGGLNKPKASGMATVPVTDVSLDGEDMFSKQMHEDDLRRMMEMAGIKQADLEPWERTMKEGDLDEAYVMNPNQAWNYGDKAGMDAEKKYDDEYNLYKTPGADPKLAQQGFTRAQAVHDRLRNALKQKPNVAEEQVQEGEECSKCHNDPCKCESVEESIRRMKEIAGIREAKKDLADKDYDGDGKHETGAEEHAGSVDKAIKKSQEEKKVEESIFALTNQWKAYRG